MTEKEDFYTRNPHALDGHPTLEPRMRTILLGWLMEVSSKQKHLLLGPCHFVADAL